MTKIDIPEAELSILESMYDSAKKHEGSHDALKLMEFDPEKYSWMRLSHNTISAGKDGPLPPPEATTYANAIDPRFSALEGELEHINSSSESMERIGEQLKSSTNVINATDHSELIDIALHQLALSNFYRRRKIAFRSGIVISKMADFLAVELTEVDEPIPVRNLLALGFDRSYLTIPNTSSTEHAISTDGRKKFNRPVTKSITADLTRRKRFGRTMHLDPMFLGIAFPGTINKIVPSTDEHVVGKVSERLLQFTNTGNTVTVAGAIRLHENGANVLVDDLPKHIETSDQLHDFMHGRLVCKLHKLDGKSYLYDKNGTITSFINETDRMSEKKPEPTDTLD